MHMITHRLTIIAEVIHKDDLLNQLWRAPVEYTVVTEQWLQLSAALSPCDSHLTMVLSRAERASLWKQMMMLAGGRSGRYCSGA